MQTDSLQADPLQILFLLPVRTQPRYKKRIRALNNYCSENSALYFERDYFKGGSLPCSSECIGNMKHGNYFQRLLVLLKSIKILRERAKPYSTVYAFNLDMAILASVSLFARKTQIVYEVADIRPVMVKKGLLSTAFRVLERLLLKRVNLLVVTSSRYVSGYFKPVQRISKDLRHLVIENKLDFPAKLINRDSEQKKATITIGYFGLLRCGRSWEVLKRVVEQSQGSIEVIVRGRPMSPTSIEEECKDIPGIRYEGEYNWPEDLAHMYGQVDIVWACYPYGEETPGNWQWARTNRFYESSYYKKPMVVLKDSEDARAVSELRIGMEIDLSDEYVAASTLVERLTQETISGYTEALNQVEEDIYLITDEHEDLIKELEVQAKSRKFFSRLLNISETKDMRFMLSLMDGFKKQFHFYFS